MTAVHRGVVYEWLRHDKKFPHVWCPGCGLGILLGSLVRALAQGGYDKNQVVLVSGIGCSGRLPVYVDVGSVHTTHGRALTFATGIKLAKPDMKVIVVMGDGDATAIGGNHLIHAARRNLDLTAIIVNNLNYGMTGGQYSPTTPLGAKASTAPYGHSEPSFDISALTVTAGASFVARSTVYHVTQLDQMLGQAIEKKGFGVVEVLSPCHTNYGRQNRLGSQVEMMKGYKKQAVRMDRWDKMSLGRARGPLCHRRVGRPRAPHLLGYLPGRGQAGPGHAEGGLIMAAGKKKESVKAQAPAMERMEVRLAGSGGQGLILAGLVLAEAAGLHDGRAVAMGQSYGPEARGGASKAEVIISDQDIDYPLATKVDLFLALTQEAADTYCWDLKPGGWIVVDSDLVSHPPSSRAVALPFTATARDKLNKPMVANVVALGALTELTGVVSQKGPGKGPIGPGAQGDREP